MKLFAAVLVALLPQLGFAEYTSCPLLGPDVPAPRKLPSSPVWKNATANATFFIESAISADLYSSANTSWALQVFSLHQDDPLYTFYHTSPVLASSPGTKNVDADSIFRLASISKLWTVLLFLIEVGDVHFTDPVTKWVPELKKIAKGSKDPVNKVDWGSITLGNLASHMSGIGRDYSALGELTIEVPSTPFVAFGLPPLTDADIPPCGVDPVCTRKQFFAGFTKRHPVHAPSTSPTYSNVAFQLLGYALESITGKSYEKMLTTDLIKKLYLNGTSYKAPTNSSRGVIPVSAKLNASGWDLDLGDEGPAGNIYSSARDMITLGRAILSSTLLSPAQTNRWMKPITFSSALQFSVGAPWEIYRAQLTQPPKIIDVYTKDGGIGVYSSNILLVPDLDIGFVVLAAGPSSAPLVAQLLAETFISAAESAAQDEAKGNYAGSYVSVDPTKLNSSIMISTDPAHPGLGVDSWITNGTDLFDVIGFEFLGLAGKNVSMRLYPTGLVTPLGGGMYEESWRAVIEPKVESTAPPRFLRSECMTWGSVDGIVYGGAGLDDFVFVLGKDRVATAVESRALRVSLKKE